MFTELAAAVERPVVFSRMTVADLWTEPYVAEQMLGYHLDGSVDIASNRTEFIDAAVRWLTETFELGPRSRVVDLGCGPGLYAGRLARTGANVTGVDFSRHSLEHARTAAAEAGLTIRYVESDYLEWQPDGPFDLALMIMRDYCAMSPEQRLRLDRKVARALAPGGAFVFDVDSLAALAVRTESLELSSAPAGGFWSPAPHFELRASFVYPEEAVALDRYTIVEPGRTRQIYNWTQFFSPETLADELARADLRIDALLGDVAGAAFDPAAPQFAVIARRPASPAATS